MIHKMGTSRTRAARLAGSSALLLSACAEQPLDFDLRGLGGGFSTAEAATGPLASRPQPDDRGVISYPNYQVAVAQRGDTLIDVAERVGLDASDLARYNGIEPDIELRRGEVVALPGRVAEPSPATGAPGTGPIQPVDISTLAGNAIDSAAATPGVQTAALPPAPTAQTQPQTGKEPIRHRVARGETAYTISRLYQVPVQALAEWNGLGPDFRIREGQFLLIPVPKQAPPKRAPRAATPEPEVALPGSGSPTPTPPSAAKPLPRDEPSAAEPAPATPTAPQTTPAPAPPVADVGSPTKPAKAARLQVPVKGSIIRGYAKGRNEGINIKAAPGSAVQAADAGTVAAVTKTGDGVPIVVVRHPDNLLTVYANVTQVRVQKGDSVRRGQTLASLRSGEDAYVHFEVRKGFDSVDPAPYLE
ncbi:MAG: LysM peptidoglycan-binding domain-containing protein [Sulfitobacter sp.]|nr:LysM peptidoglycan-binding domain-containing protein [Sulfitobacter sp.]